VQKFRKDEIKKEMDPEKGKAEGRHKIDLAGDKRSELVQIARRIARDLGENGPITVDDVTAKMSETYNVLPAKDKKRQSWKGSIFTRSEWRYIGDQPSQQKSAHSRPVGVWALKTWLQKHTLNGRNTHVSAYVVSRLFSDFKRLHPGANPGECNWYIGEEQIADEIRDLIVDDDNKLYGVPVHFVPGAVGAIMHPGNPGAAIVSVARKEDARSE
jgi:hypothetical protein